MKKLLMNPLCALLILAVVVCLFWAGGFLLYPGDALTFYEDGHPADIFTYSGYALAFVVACCYVKDFTMTGKLSVWIAMLFLEGVAVLREMGAQHWLTSHDTTAIKIHFFTNPNNPIHEKIISAVVILSVLGTIFWLFFKYVRQIIREFFKINPLYWTVVTFGGTLFLLKFADRFPSRYAKITGEHLSDYAIKWFTLFEEAPEACLPLMFALGIIQHHILLRRKRR